MALSLRCSQPLASNQGAKVATRVRLRPTPQRGQLLIVAGKGKNRMRSAQGMMAAQKPPTPPVDPDNEEFVVFVRAKKLPRWIPFTIVKGGAQANVLVKAMQGNFGKEFYSKTLINNIGQAIYKEKDQLIASVRNGMPGYKNFTEFEFGFKIRNKQKPEDWYLSDGVVLLPPESDIPKGVLDNMKQSFGAMFGGNKASASS